jgi:pyrimidine-nucleoside phosphorylase
VLDDYTRLPAARARRAVKAPRDGYLTSMKAALVGRACKALGAGRQRIEDRIDYGAGVLAVKKPGEKVSAGDTILELLYNDDRGLNEAVQLANAAVSLADAAPPPRPLVLGIEAAAAR